MKFAWVVVLGALILAACGGSDSDGITSEESWRQSGPDCFSDRYRDAIGLEIGGRGQFAPGNALLDADREPLANDPQGFFEPLETFTVLEGPECWAMPITSNTAILQQRRFWKVRSETRDLEGWIDEYAALMTQPTAYFAHPLAEDDTPLEMGVPLAEPLEFASEIQLAEGIYQTHSVPFTDSGYVSVNFAFDASAGDACVLHVYVPSPQSIKFEDGRLHVAGRAVERLFVNPGSYEFRVGYTWPGPENCPDVPYTLRFAPIMP